MLHEVYLEIISKDLAVAYALAQRCRAKGHDPELHVETPLAQNMVDRVVGLISIVAPQIVGAGVVERIRELEHTYGAQDWRVALVIALEVAQGTYCKFRDKLEAMEVGIRVGVAYTTNGVVSSPLEGFTGIKIRKRRDGGEYFALCFSGPIRSAGGTGASVSVLIGDYVRAHLGYAPYDPSQEEIERMVTELYDYHERVTNLQYLPSEDEIRFMVSRLPVQIDGDPSETTEVSNYKGLSRIETNRIRNGPCLTIGEGLCQKAPKLLRNLLKWGKDMKMGHWLFLEEFLHLQKSIKAKQQGVVATDQKIKPDFTFIKDLVAGRPVFTHPLARGGFRLRYGRCRNSGFSCQAIHPATMVLVNKFIAIGTQLKVERPGKSAVIASCDTIEGPIVKLNNGDVLFIENVPEARRVLPQVEEILYLGDLLINYGDFFNRNHLLVPSGYCEEWWALELRNAVAGKDPGTFRDAIEHIFYTPFAKVDASLAIALTKSFGVAFHPRYTFRWRDITREDFVSFYTWFVQSPVEEQKIVFSLAGNLERKRILELLGVPHRCVAHEYAVVEGDWALALRFSLENVNLQASAVLEMLHQGVLFRDKSGTSIGARMGRPEKAKMRKLTGSPHILFPVGDEGGRMRCFESVLTQGFVTAQFPLFYCTTCASETVYGACERCGATTLRRYFCRQCNRLSFEQCHSAAVPYRLQKLDIRHYFNSALRSLQLRAAPALVKGVRGTSNRDHVLEHLVKGILRAHYNLYVNRDGTIRYDMTEMPLTHFKPCEIMTSFEVLRSLGYTSDISGKELTRDDQILELKIQDVILPCSEESLEESSRDVLFKTSKFVDDLLVRLYKERTFYNLQRPEDIVGHYIVGLAPHISAGIVGRVIGFSKTQGFLAHPCFHSIMRRDCDGDESGIILLMDMLLNFSRRYLPDHRGATQDAPLVLTSTLLPHEVDDMVFDMDVAWHYPRELYEAAQQYKHPSEVKVEQLKGRLGTPRAYEDYGFTHHVEDINEGVLYSAYKALPTMSDKVLGQMDLANKIRAVDSADVAKQVIERHFIRDIRGNLRKFSMQQFRCVKCNEKYRRPPLVGHCLKCQGNIIFTVAEGSITKYLEPSLQLAEKYQLSAYLRQSLEITKRRIESIFGKQADKQVALGKWFG